MTKIDLFCLSCFCFLMAILVNRSSVAQEGIRLAQNTIQDNPSPWRLQPKKTESSLRGLHVVSENIVWASGTDGVVINTTDGGTTWRLINIPGAAKLDIRDVQALDDATVIAMTSGTPARIYRSTDAGLNWQVVFESTDPRVFLDSISFWDQDSGLAMADAIDNHLLLLATQDAGLTWRELSNTPTTAPKEGGFAASGTNMVVVGNQTVMIGLGSGLPAKLEESRIVYADVDFESWQSVAVPIPRFETAGIFSVHFADNKTGVLVGGDYKQPDSTDGNYAITRDGGMTWAVPQERSPPSGYRSCVSHRTTGADIEFVAVGPNGTDLSLDLGETWAKISNEGFHAVQFSPDGKSGWAVGADGRIAKWIGRK